MLITQRNVQVSVPIGIDAAKTMVSIFLNLFGWHCRVKTVFIILLLSERHRLNFLIAWLHDWEGKSWVGYLIWQKHPRFNCSRQAIENLLKKSKSNGSRDWLKCSGSPVTALRDTTEEECEELIVPERDKPGSDYSIRKIAPHLHVSKTTAYWFVKRRKLILFKRISTLQMNQVCYMRQAKWASNLPAKFSVHSDRTLAFQDEKDFTVQVKTNRQNDRIYEHRLESEFIMWKLWCQPLSSGKE